MFLCRAKATKIRLQLLSEVRAADIAANFYFCCRREGGWGQAYGSRQTSSQLDLVLSAPDFQWPNYFQLSPVTYMGITACILAAALSVLRKLLNSTYPSLGGFAVPSSRLGQILGNYLPACDSSLAPSFLFLHPLAHNSSLGPCLLNLLAPDSLVSSPNCLWPDSQSCSMSIASDLSVQKTRHIQPGEKMTQGTHESSLQISERLPERRRGVVLSLCTIYDAKQWLQITTKQIQTVYTCSNLGDFSWVCSLGRKNPNQTYLDTPEQTLEHQALEEQRACPQHRFPH